MGRGRAKAKQTKVARALKYHSPDTDFVSLQRELGGAESDAESDEFNAMDDEEDEDDEEDDPPSEDGTWATRPR
jgi:Protein of unknown function (DUF3073)